MSSTFFKSLFWVPKWAVDIRKLFYIYMFSIYSWHYFCLDILQTLSQLHAMPNQPTAVSFYLKQVRVFKLGSVPEFFIDEVLIGRQQPVANIEGMFFL